MREHLHRLLPRRGALRRLRASAMAAVIVTGTVLGSVAPAAPVLAATNHVTLSVVSARTEPLFNGGAGVTVDDPITTYKWMINLDNTGTNVTRDAKPGSPCSAWSDAAHTTPNPGYPDSCTWTSVTGLLSTSPVMAQGNEGDLNGTAGLDLPNGKYLISVMADGFKMDGTPFTLPAASGLVTVPLQPTPLPTTTIKAEVFADVTEANGQYDPGEDGLTGFAGNITDYLGQVNTDVFGNPLCTKYQFNDLNNDGVQDPGETIVLDATQSPIVTHQGAKCLSGDINMDGVVDATDESLYLSKGLDPQVARGELTIPNLGTNRYALSMVPPKGSSWIQTTTLEGNHDWDAWAMEGATGYDTEFVVGGEPFPAIIFGYVPGPSTTYWNDPAHSFRAGGTGTIKGTVDATDVYVPAKGGQTLPGTIWGGLSGAKVDHPIGNGWITLSDLGRGDTAVYVGHTNADGTFQINNVPDGTYTLTYWDEPQDFILDLVSVTVAGGETVDMGVLPLTGWWTPVDGYVFNDTNRNGKRDAGEPGVPNFTLTLRKRENSLMDRGTTTVTTDQSGHYYAEAVYPLTEWIILEAYDDRYYTTGVTYQADNQPVPTTVLGAGVDVSLLPIIGLSGKIDWGVHAYDAAGTSNGADPRNGGIVGSVSYDTTRNELDPQYAVAEDWQPGVQGITVELHAPVDCGTDAGAPCDARGDYELNADGSYVQGKLLNTYVSETWQKPTGCVARDVDGNPLANPADQQVLPVNADGTQNTDAGCLEGPLMGVQFGPYGTDQGTPDANFGAAVDGNYGFGDACLDGTVDATDPSNPQCVGGSFTPLDAGDYLVHIDLAAKKGEADGKQVYKVTTEEDVNIGNGDQFVPQVPPPACAGPLHTVDVANDGTTDGYPVQTLPDPSGNGGTDLTVAPSTPIDNATFLDIGGSPFEGQARPLCDTKLVTVQNGKSVVPMFNVWTDVPLPGRFFGYNVDDLAFSTDPKSLLFGEKSGLPFNPVGIYDFANRLITTVETDYNGVYDVLLPSTNRINCPTPSGVCANLYRFVGNDPGVPGRLNENFNPRYRTIAADFEVFPGLITPADNAPTQVGVTVQLPGGQPQVAITCTVNDPAATAATKVPEFFSISQPYVPSGQAGAARNRTISGRSFGTAAGTILVDGTPRPNWIQSWSDTQIVIRPPAGFASGPHQVLVQGANGKTAVNGIVLHVMDAGTGGYNPPVYEVGPQSNPNYSAAKVTAGRWFTPANSLPATADHAIQRALDAASAGALVVVYPNNPTTTNPRLNPRGAYYENLIISKRVKLQGAGPGSPDGSVKGSIIDGGAFAGDSPVATDWYTRIGTLTWAGNQDIFDGAVVSLFLPATGSNAFPAAYSAATAPTIDGFDLRGGDQMGFPGNINAIGGTPTGQPGGLITQGGAIFANGYARNLQVTNNIVQNNGGAYGTIRIGNPNLPAPLTDNQNRAVRIANNRIIQNGGTNLAGGIGIFAGADGYSISNNDICGNFSAEYGGGVSVYGYSPNGSIDHNRVYYNQSYDEGGGIMIAGELPTDPSILSPGTGAVSIHENVVQANMANDDGGGIRFLMAGNFPMTVFNNIVVNNVSTHEGGGLALDDTPKARIYNNTIMKNVTTATAVTSDGTPAPAGLSTGANSVQLQATLPLGSPLFSNPILFNNIFWDNRAGTRVLGSVTGIGQPGDATPVNNWDLGAGDGSGILAPTNSVIQQSAGTYPYVASPTNVVADPKVVDPYDTVLDFMPWRTNPNFVGAILVAADLPPAVLGDYHIRDDSTPTSPPTSPAFNLGAASKVLPAYAQPPASLAAPTTDIDGQVRPALGGFDSGADEFPGVLADLSVTKDDGVTSTNPGSVLHYTITVANAGPSAVALAPVTDTVPTALTGVTWTCTAPAGSTCGAASGSGNIATTVSLPAGGSATFTLNGTVAASATGTLVNTASVAAPAGAADPATGNNSATDTDTIVPLADLSITKDDGRTSVTPGTAVGYSIVVSNAGPSTATNAVVNDPMPAGLNGVAWTCTASAGSACGTATGTGNITNRTVTLPSGGSATFSVTATLAVTATGSLANTATVAAPAGTTDPNTANNSATDTDMVAVPALPVLAVLDAFNRANAVNLGASWSQPNNNIRLNANQAQENNGATGFAYWNVPTTGFGAKQGAAFTAVNGVADDSLILKATAGTATAPQSYVRVRLTSNSVVVETTVNSGGTFTPQGTPLTSANANLAAGDRLTAQVDAAGLVSVWRTRGTTTVYAGSVQLPNVALWTTGGGRIGMSLANGNRVDDFSGGTLP